MLKVIQTFFSAFFSYVFPESLSTKRNKLLLSQLNSKNRPIVSTDSISIFSYQLEPVKQAVLLLKRQPYQLVGDIFAETISKNLLDKISTSKNVTLVSIPSHQPSSLHDQSFFLRKKLFSTLKQNHPQTKILTADIAWKNPPQKQSLMPTRAARIQNRQDCFRLASKKDQAAIKQSNHIIVIDDVITSGSTMNAAKKVLRHYNHNAKIIAVSFARQEYI